MKKIFVNKEKEERALDIIKLITGRRVPIRDNDAEIDRKERFTIIFREDGIDPKSPEALEYLYTKLGGLIRTEEEEKIFQEKVAIAKKKKITR